MTKYLKYLWYVIRHKWFVFLACCHRRMYWLGIIHDWSKLLPSEFFPYAKHFYGKGKRNCCGCKHIWGSQCGINGSGIGQGEQASDCKDYIKKEARDQTGYYKPTDTGDPDFDFAWLLHQKRNRHHWQWWILPEDEGGVKILQMQGRYVAEMLCDWLGASRAQRSGSSVPDWYSANGRKMQLHTITRDVIEYALGAMRRKR